MDSPQSLAQQKQRYIYIASNNIILLYTTLIIIILLQLRGSSDRII